MVNSLTLKSISKHKEHKINNAFQIRIINIYQVSDIEEKIMLNHSKEYMMRHPYFIYKCTVLDAKPKLLICAYLKENKRKGKGSGPSNEKCI